MQQTIAYPRAIEGSRDKSVQETAFQEHPIRSRGMDPLKDEMEKAFRREGVALRFEAPGKNGAVSNTN